jgi:hypothetical protein
LFSLAAQKAGFEAHANAEADGLGIVVSTDAGPTRVRTVDAAMCLARDHIGQFLAPASHGEIPWGLLVSVAEGSAAYGEWPLSGGRRRRASSRPRSRASAGVGTTAARSRRWRTRWR